MQTYEQQLANDPRWALSEGSRYFEEKSAVQDALRKITKRLAELEIPYAVVGGMALFGHGYRRFTDDVDILVARDGLREIHEQLDGLGYVPPFPGSKNLRDAESGVKIEFLVAGQFPGDGKPKPVSFPDPSAATVEIDGIRYIALPKLVELKLASGISQANRIRDLADVQELIKLLRLPRDFAQQLDASVRSKFEELWTAMQGRERRYLRRLNKLDPVDQSLLREMLAAGASLDSQANAQWLTVVTSDGEFARRFDMHDEEEFLDPGERGA